MPEAAIWGVVPLPGPAGELMGWELTSSNIGLAPFGINGNTLPTYTTNPVPNGTTITEKKIVWSGGRLDLSAGDILIERCLLQPTSISFGDTAVVICDPPDGSPVQILDSELDGSLCGTEEISHACGFRGLFDIRRTWVHDVGSGICTVDHTNDQDDAIVINCLINNLRGFGDPGGSGSHNEAATTRCLNLNVNPARQAIWRGNWIDTSGAPDNSSGGLFLQPNSCEVGNVIAENNLIDGGPNWDLYGDGSPYGGTMESTNNRFVPGGFGACSVTGFSWDVWTENYVNDAGQPDNKGASISGC